MMVGKLTRAREWSSKVGDRIVQDRGDDYPGNILSHKVRATIPFSKKTKAKANVSPLATVV